MKKLVSFLKRSVLAENPTLTLLLGLCPLLAVTTRLSDGVVFGVVAFFALLLSTLLISVVKKAIPKSVRDIVYIVIIAFVVVIFEEILGAFLPEITARIGIYLPLLAISGILFSQSAKLCEERKLSVALSDGLACGVGYLATAVCLSLVRELLGRGSVLGFRIIPADYAMGLVVTPVGGFLLFGILVAALRRFFAEATDSEVER